MPWPGPKCSTHITLPSPTTNGQRTMESPWQIICCHSLWRNSSPKIGDGLWHVFPHSIYKSTCAGSSRHWEISRNWQLSYDSIAFVNMLEDLLSSSLHCLIIELEFHKVEALKFEASLDFGPWVMDSTRHFLWERRAHKLSIGHAL